MNSNEKYLGDLAEAMNEDAIGTLKFISEERTKALDSYPKEALIKMCQICNEPMVYNSVAYQEGYHIDSCI